METDQTRKYLLHGDEVVVIEELSIGYLVAQAYEGEEDEEILGHPYFVDKVYDKAPTEKLDSALVSLQHQVADLTAQKNSLTKEIKEVKEFEGKRLERYRQFEQLKRLDDFLDGKITHYVILDYSTLKILPIAETKSEYGKELRLLTFFGDSKGDLNWKLNRHPNGSGSYTSVIPCTSYEEAVEHLKKEMDARLEKNQVASMYEIEACKKYGLKMPRKYVEAYRDKLLEAKRKDLESLKRREEVLLGEIETLSPKQQPAA